ncbi:MAG: rhodanese-like domain-containing protein [Bacteroidota bacterium]
MKLEKTIQNNEGTIVDVRTPTEFHGGHATNSINIPLHEVSKRIEELKKMKTPVVLCCASGGRSAQAAFLLTTHKIECIDAGPWNAVHSLQS